MSHIIRIENDLPVVGSEQPLPQSFGNISYPALTQMLTQGFAEYLPPVYDASRQALGDYVQQGEAWSRQVVDRPVAELQSTAWENIKSERDRRKGGGVNVAGKWFHSDDASRIQQLGLVVMGANLPAGIQWKTMDGSFVAMTPTLAGQIFQAVAGLDMANFANAEAHRFAMLSLSDPLSYDFSGGWLPTYGEV